MNAVCVCFQVDELKKRTYEEMTKGDAALAIRQHVEGGAQQLQALMDTIVERFKDMTKVGPGRYYI